MKKLIDLDTAIVAVEKESQVDGAYGYMDTKSIVDLLNGLPLAQSKKFSEVLRDMMDEDYYLFCHTGYSRLAENDWEWLIEQAKGIEQSEKEN